ncbi:MAG: hypothetical protein ACK5OB_11320 [Pirellula sp.]
MDLGRLIEDPAWLFDFSFPLKRFEPQGDPRDPTAWSLSEAHRLVGLNQLSFAERQHETRMGWNENGLYLWIEIPRLAKRDPNAVRSEVALQFLIDTRCSPDIHRGTQFCHDFTYRFRSMNDETAEHSRMSAILTAVSRAKEAPRIAMQSDLWGWLTLHPKVMRIQVYIDSQTLTGYEPTEFDACGMNYVVLDPQYRRFSMARLSHTIPLDDPSLWCRAQLVE